MAAVIETVDAAFYVSARKQVLRRHGTPDGFSPSGTGRSADDFFYQSVVAGGMLKTKSRLDLDPLRESVDEQNRPDHRWRWLCRRSHLQGSRPVTSPV